MQKDEIALTADWQNEMSDVIGKISFNGSEKAQLFYNLLKSKPEMMNLGVGYITNTNTGETELIEVSMYVDYEKAERHKQWLKSMADQKRS